MAGPTRVEPLLHGPDDVGDEALLHAQAGPTVIAVDRPAGAALAVGLGADVVVMDDGLQNPSLAKDLRLAVVDAGFGIGNGLCIPAGPLRAPLPAQWPQVDALILIGEGGRGEAVAAQAAAREIVVFRGALAPDPKAAAELAGRNAIAFAGIGRPEKFFDTLERAGARIVSTRAFGDHHRFTKRELAILLAEAETRDTLLVTTEKDRVRLPRDLPPTFAARLRTLPVALALQEEARFAELLRQRLLRRPSPPAVGE